MKIYRYVFLVILLFLLINTAYADQCQEKQAQTLSMLTQNISEFVPDKIIEYKNIDQISLNLHIFLPPAHKSGDNAPAIISFFGGGWINGTIKHFYRQSAYWASRGMVAVCADYRVKSRHKAEPYQCLQDAKSAIRYLRANSDQLGIDPNSIAAAGGSAGGHLAIAAATIEKFDDLSDDLSISCKPNALILFNPVIDNGPQGYGYERVSKYWRDFSPIHNIDANTPQTIFLVGSKDGLIPVSTAKKYKQLCETYNIRCELFIYPEQRHGFFNYQKKDYRHFLQTLLETDRFLISIGYLKGIPLIPEQKL